MLTLKSLPAHHASWLFALWLAGAAPLARAAGPADDGADNTPETLRAAVTDLIGTFGARYPNGKAYLQRLDALAPNDREGFTALQREALTANPLVRDHPILFVARRQYPGDHHNTATLFQNGEINAGKYAPPGVLKTVDFAAGGTVTTLFDPGPTALVRDPEVNFDGKQIVFAMRRERTDGYHIYEIRSEGSGLRQLTRAASVCDIDPLYLADGSIAFSSTREPKYCGCNRHIMANLFRMFADGTDIHQLGKSTLFEGHGALLPDGRILYDRWEYVDRDFGDAQGLWTVNPDGTGQALYWGNNTSSPGAVLDARPIPGTQEVLCIYASCHDRPWGAMAILDRRYGIDVDGPADRAMTRRIWPAAARGLIGQGGFDAFRQTSPKYEDPYPLSPNYFLCSRQTGKGDATGIYLTDRFGNELLLHAEAPGCFDPMPLAPRVRPPHAPARRTFLETTGTFYVLDVYRGTNMAGVERGSIKQLRVVESPEKRAWTPGAWGGQGQQAPAMNWHNFENKRILGTVPVEADGSAYFEAPADTFLFFQLLDADGKMVHSMRSGTVIQPGETSGCVGCHEARLSAPPPSMGPLPIAMTRPPSKLAGWHGPPRLFSFRKEVQPVLDKHCVRCHDFGTKGGKALVLAGDKGLVFNASYVALHTDWRGVRGGRFISTVGGGPPEVQNAYAWGSHQSSLMQTLEKGHYEVKLNREEMDRLITWIDINAPYYPVYTSAYPNNPAGRAPLTRAELKQLEQLTGDGRLGKAFRHAGNPGPLVSFDRPELSPCLDRIREDSVKLGEAVALITLGKQRLRDRPGADSDTFAPAEIDRQREERYAQREVEEAINRAALARQDRRVDSGPASE